MRTARPVLTAATAALLLLHGAAASGGLYSDTVLADNPVGYWRLGEAAGAAQAQDLAPGSRPARPCRAGMVSWIAAGEVAVDARWTGSPRRTTVVADEE